MIDMDDQDMPSKKRIVIAKRKSYAEMPKLVGLSHIGTPDIKGYQNRVVRASKRTVNMLAVELCFCF